MARLLAAVLVEVALLMSPLVVMCARVDDDASHHQDPVGTAIEDVKKAEEEVAGQRQVMEFAAASHSKAVEQVRMADDLNRRARDMAMAKGALESEAVASREAAARDTAVAVARHEATRVSEEKAKVATEAVAFAAKKAADTVVAKSYAEKTKEEAEEACITSKRMTTQGNLMTGEAARQKSEFEKVAAAAADAKAHAKMAVMEKDAAKANLARLCGEDAAAGAAEETAAARDKAVQASINAPEKANCFSKPGDGAIVEPGAAPVIPVTYAPTVPNKITQASTLQASPAGGVKSAVPASPQSGFAEVGAAATTAAPAGSGSGSGWGSITAPPQQTPCGEQVATQTAASSGSGSGSGSISGSGPAAVAASASLAISKIQHWLR